MTRSRGFTLIELMIAVAIIAILAAIALPSYTDYIRRSRVTEAISTLSGMRVKMEQYYQDNRKYDGACAVARGHGREQAAGHRELGLHLQPSPGRQQLPHHRHRSGNDARFPVHAGSGQQPRVHDVVPFDLDRQRRLLGGEKGRIVLSAGRAYGFTLIELLVGITLLAILLGLGAPALGNYLQNSKLASAAASYFNGVQMARTEAIRRNLKTEFILTDTPVSASDAANTAVLSSSGKNWIVRAASGAGHSLVEAKAGAEGEGSAAAPAVQVSATAPAIPFNGFGATADGLSYTIDISNPAAGACAPGGTIRCRRIIVSPGGQVAACDPAASAALGDSRGCP